MLKQYLELPRSVHILCVGTFINRAGSFFMVFLTIYLSKKLGYEITFATTCIGLFGLGAIISSLLGGHLADRWGRRIVMLISLFGGAVILALFSYLQSRAAIMSATFALALISTMYRPAASAMIGDLTKPSQRPTAFGLMFVSINLGFACGAAVGGKLASFSFHWLFWGDAITTFAYGLIILLSISETLPNHRNPLRSRNQLANPPASSVESPTLVQAASHIVRDGTFLLFCLGMIMINFVYMQSISTLPIYLQSLNFEPDDYGFIIALNGLLIVLFQLPLTVFFGRFNRMIVITLGAIVMGIGFGLIGMATVRWQFASTVVVWTFGEMMQAPFTSAIVADLAPTSLRGRYMGVFGMSFSTSLMIGVPLGGEVMARFGPTTLWNGTLGLALLAAILFFLLTGPIEKRHVADTTICEGGADRSTA